MAYQAWWETEGWPISLAIDRLGTPPLRLFNERGERIDEVGYPPVTLISSMQAIAPASSLKWPDGMICA